MGILDTHVWLCENNLVFRAVFPSQQEKTLHAVTKRPMTCPF